MKIIHIIRMILLALSTMGYILFLTKKMRVEFAVGFTFAAIPGCLFLAGILNLLPETALLLFILGFVCLGLSIRDHIPLKNLISFGSIFLAVGGIALFYILYGGKFADQDIFDHWGTVIRVLIRYNRFPTYLKKNISHKTYPTGTACWIYYWLFISGMRAEYIQIFAQNLLFLGMAVSLFPLCSKPVTKLLTAAVCIMMLCGNRELYSIQVDNILAITAISAVSFGIYYRSSLNKKSAWIIAWCVFLAAAKNSGLLFVFFILLLLFPWLHWKKAGILACITGITAILWSKHTQLVFTNALTAKHTMSIENYQTVLGQKSRDDIITIYRMFRDREILLKGASYNKYIWLLILAVLLIIICFFLRSEESRLARRLGFYSILCYCIHETGLLMVYFASMPLKEALNLSHYSRYQKTAVVFSAGILLIAVLILLKKESGFVRNLLSTAAALICCLFFKFGINPNWNYLMGQNPRRLAERNYFDQVIAQYNIPDNKMIMTYTDSGEDPHNYFNALCRYYFFPAKIQHAVPETVNNLDSWDYILVLTESEEARRIITEGVQSDQVTVVIK